MPDEETIDRRLRAVERSLTESDQDVQTLRDIGDLVERIESLERTVESTEDRVIELEAATQALRGYVGNIRSVNLDVERRVDTALSIVERLETRNERESDGMEPYHDIKRSDESDSSSNPSGHERGQNEFYDRPSGSEDTPEPVQSSPRTGSTHAESPSTGTDFESNGWSSVGVGPKETQTLLQRVRNVL